MDSTHYDVALDTARRVREKVEKQMRHVEKLERAIRLCKHFKLPMTGRVGLQFNGNLRDLDRATFTVKYNGKVHDTVPATSLPFENWPYRVLRDYTRLSNPNPAGRCQNTKVTSLRAYTAS